MSLLRSVDSSVACTAESYRNAHRISLLLLAEGLPATTLFFPCLCCGLQAAGLHCGSSQPSSILTSPFCSLLLTFSCFSALISQACLCIEQGNPLLSYSPLLKFQIIETSRGERPRGPLRLPFLSNFCDCM